MPFINIGEKVRHVKYARWAKKHNDKARLLRLEQTTFQGYPLPTGKEGRLVITSGEIISNPNRVSSSRLNKAYEDRALDLKADIWFDYDIMTRDWIITWRPHKGRWPRERY